MNRIDEHEVGLGLLGGICQKTLQIAVIADAPRFAGPHGIHLRHPAPPLVLGDRLRHGNARGGGDDGRLALAPVNRDGQRVVAHRQIGGDGQVRLAGIEVRQQGKVAKRGAVLQFDGGGDVRVRRAVQGDAGRFAGGGDDGGGEQTFAVFHLKLGHGAYDGLVAGCVHVEGLEYGDQGRVADFGVGAELVDE